jgi:muramoyltetrapeptide carboxypeptidase LdcA involved in peptidoglycan recycling
VSELGEFPQVLPQTDRSLRAAWFGGEPLTYEPAETWTDEFLDWEEQSDLTRARELRPSAGWRTIRAGRATGPLLGGCLETVCWHLKGSDAWVDPSGAILFLEMSEEAPSPADVDGYLTDLEQLGVFEQAVALVVGRPYGYDDAAAEALWEVVAARTDAAGIPVLANGECGHTDPLLTLPLGAEAEVDAGARALRLLEPATA